MYMHHLTITKGFISYILLDLTKKLLKPLAGKFNLIYRISQVDKLKRSSK